MYLFAFDEDRSFFYERNSSAIYAFLCEKYWGDTLLIKLKLLVRLFECDSSLQPSKIKKEIIKKSEELNKYLNQNTE